jgi:hypothetical protein
MPEQGAPGDEEAQLTHQGKGQRQKNDNCDKDCVRQHGKLPCRLGSRSSWEKPCYEVHGAHGHADSEDNAGKDSLGLGVTRTTAVEAQSERPHSFDRLILG